MYQYEQILNEHRQRVERGVRNYERLRVLAERAAKSSASKQNSREVDVIGTGEPEDCDDGTFESDVHVGTSSMR
ncbi:hypothetical protein ASG84_23895 [Rhodococcus sp. Leaf278]|nr:hypothetical protein ASG84_23895 [Rhodococcus sp. Leaf278]